MGKILESGSRSIFGILLYILLVLCVTGNNELEYKFSEARQLSKNKQGFSLPSTDGERGGGEVEVPATSFSNSFAAPAIAKSQKSGQVRGCVTVRRFSSPPSITHQHSFCHLLLHLNCTIRLFVFIPSSDIPSALYLHIAQYLPQGRFSTFRFSSAAHLPDATQSARPGPAIRYRVQSYDRELPRLQSQQTIEKNTTWTIGIAGGNLTQLVASIIVSSCLP